MAAAMRHRGPDGEGFLVNDPRAPGLTAKTVAGGLLVQTRDNAVVEDMDLKPVTKRAPSNAELRDLRFAFRVAKHVKSNTIVYAKDSATVGIGAGQMSRVDAARIAARKAQDRVLAEAFRVLKPGGRLAVSDVVVRGAVPAEIRRSMELWVGCIAGALEEKEYQEKLARAGFESIDVEATRVYKAEEAREFLAAAGLDANVVGPQIDGKFVSAFVRAVKPARKAACCGPSCCA